MEKSGKLIDWRAVFLGLLFLIILIAIVSAVKVVKIDSPESSSIHLILLQLINA